MAVEAKTIQVSHLSTTAGYYHPLPLDQSKPTLVLINSFTTAVQLYEPQYGNKQLTDAVNLLAIEPYGHGSTRTDVEHFTYWDTALMALQVLEKLGVKKAFALGTSQGGWIVARMALLAPEAIQGIVILGTSMDYESPRSTSLGCWDGVAAAAPLLQAWTTPAATPDFELPDQYADFLCGSGFGENCSPEMKDKWSKLLKANYSGDDGRRRIRMAAINLSDRDGLHRRVVDIRCPVLWMHGTADAVYSVANAQEEIKLFTNAKAVQLRVVEGGAHFLSASHPNEVDSAVLEFMKETS